MLLSKHRYSWAEISEMMHRSHGAIARRCRDLGIKDRPVSMELTGKRGTWTSEDFEILADGIRHGDSYAAIGKAVGRSEKCVRSKVYNDYLTENADKVREMLGDGSWGHVRRKWTSVMASISPAPAIRSGVTYPRWQRSFVSA